ncbi:hemolysin regulation protein AhpA [Actinobacillus seminis]|uniref:Hemolysin regulation protein AhpA n=2 Tax=Actinobacillus seminis TaxID=722 RepID=A0ABX4FSA1_9PAST|nr:YtjB family periplasmic protein [Actinobacillus seminis]OZN25188.1 hemolysin regulation protein AhpA [Actinobacillus seminis]
MYLTKEKLVKIMLIVSIIGFCGIILGVILFGVQQFKIGSQLASVKQVSHLSHLLVRQQADLFSMLLVNDAKTEQLTENLDNFSKENFVIDASIYSNAGELLAQSSHSLNVRHQLGLDANTGTPTGTQQIVELIYSPNGIEGFLRVTFDAKYGQTTQSKINQLFHQLYGELIIVFLAGIVFASSIHYFLSHYRRAHRKAIEPKPLAKVSKINPTLNFHRRRKRFVK